jgi:multiple sugar transport system substrate-binding protein
MKKWVVGASVVAAFGMAALGQSGTISIGYWNINTEAFGAPAVRELIAGFEKQNPGIKVESRAQTGYTGLLQNTQAAIAGGNPPEVVQVGYLYTNYVAENLPFQEIRALAERNGATKHLDSFPKSIFKLGTVGNQLVGLPYSLSNMIGYVNLDLVKKAGLDPNKLPNSWEGWRKLAPDIKAKTGKYAISMGYNDDNWSIEGLIASNGGNLLECQNGEQKAVFDSKEGAAALQLWADLVKNSTWLNANYQQGEQAFLAGETLVHFTTIASRANYQRNAKFELRGIGYPRFGSKPVRIPGGGNVLVSFAKDTAKQAAAWKFIQYLTSNSGFSVWTKGTGYVPLLPSLSLDSRYLKDFIAQNPIQQVGIRQLGNTITWTSFPGNNGLAAGQSLFKAVQQALSSQSPADVALKSAAIEVNRLIAGEKCK